MITQRFSLTPLMLAMLAASSFPTWATDDSGSVESKTNQQISSDDSSEPSSSDDVVKVYGRALSLYRAQETTFATKTPTDIDKTPQSVQVLPRQLIEDQGAREITDLYRSISGLSAYNYSYVTFRGFRQDETLFDGVRGNPFEGFSIPQLFNIERVEVLKGPSAALNGGGEPGGVINYVTKKPTVDTKRKVSVTGGNDDFASGSVELSGSANDAQTQRYRIGVYQDHENPARKNTDVRNRIIDLGYEIDTSEDTTLGLQFMDVQQHNGGYRLRGIPVDDNGNFLTSTDWNANEASDYQDLDAQVYQARLDHYFDEHWSGNLTLRYFENTETQRYHEPNGLLDTDSDGVYDTTKRQLRDQLWKHKAGSVTGNLIAEYGDHTVLMGADYYHIDTHYVYYRGTASNLSLTDPVYDEDTSSVATTLNKETNTRSERYGLYLQDQWDVTARWNVTSGLRWDGFSDHIDDIKNDATDEYDGGGMSYRLGSTYELTQNVHPYAVVATGFVPQDAAKQASSAGGPFDPEESIMKEVGVRTYWLDNKVNLNLAAYHIIKENVLQEDPEDDDKYVAYGKVRSQGIEADVLADLTENWAANLSYAYNDTRVKQAYDGISRSVGTRFANAPHHQLGAWTRYDLASLNSSVGFGASYVSEQLSQDGQRVKPYTIYDASWQTKVDDWTVQLNIKNLFDKEYAVSGFLERTGHFVGEGRRVYLTASYDF
ncbi:TonB-dependent siderophore receptor [Vibrio viridaestus]|uniref:TonB-dependent receptor n=1 Tax=Vibrio viridaestus TaxID=2487322 RepID=A0A3N9TLW0_9VIBR|nr:TonB-dependent receptor [Vibrio viridaestus]RQW64833.1 TonB-dependent receptor [Vibrio viridaestus]